MTLEAIANTITDISIDMAASRRRMSKLETDLSSLISDTETIVEILTNFY